MSQIPTLFLDFGDFGFDPFFVFVFELLLLFLLKKNNPVKITGQTPVQDCK
jgi:hypothetical protein